MCRLMVPFEVIDSLQLVKEFLSTGQHNFSKQKQKARGVDNSNEDLMRYNDFIIVIISMFIDCSGLCLWKAILP